MSNNESSKVQMKTVGGLQVQDLSVNHAGVNINGDGQIVLTTGAALPEHFKFNGGSEGWKAIAGISNYNNELLENFQLSYTFSGSASSSEVYFNLLVDADVVNGEPISGEEAKGPLIIVVNKVNGGGESNRLTFNRNDFMIVGYRKKGSTSGWGDQHFSLSDLSPKAKLTDKKSDDNGMPKNEKLDAVMLIVGDSASKREMNATIDAISISPNNTGSSSSNVFDDTGIVEAAGNPKITQMRIRFGNVLNAIQAMNTGTGSQESVHLSRHGGDSGAEETINIPLDDPIVSISGYTGTWFGWHCVLQLTLTGKSGATYGPFGNMDFETSKTPFTQSAPDGQSVVAFSGSTEVVPLADGSHTPIIKSLKASFA